MATQMQRARAGETTDAMRIVAEEERVSAEFVREGVAAGRIAIPTNVGHTNLRPRGVGAGLRVKVNANIGTSNVFPDIEPELEKLDEAVRCGADAVMDLSTGDISTSRGSGSSNTLRSWWGRCRSMRRRLLQSRSAAR